MTTLQKRQMKIQERRKQTPWREFVKEIASRCPLVLHKNNGHISIYPDEQRVKNVMKLEEFQKLRDSLCEYSIPASNQGLFHDFALLLKNIPIYNVNHFGVCENSDYAEGVYQSNNAYLSNTVVMNCENVLYSFNVKDNCKQVIASSNIVKNCENVFMSGGVVSSFNVFFSHYINNSSDIRYSTNLVGCSECIRCNDLQNQSYCIDNVPYEQNMYHDKKKELLPILMSSNQTGGNFSVGPLIESPGSTGGYLTNCTDIINGYESYNVVRGRNVMYIGSEELNEEYYDVFLAGRSTDFYGACYAGGYSNHCYIVEHIVGGSHIFYSIGLENCSYCLGCIGLKNKSFCIFNQQYTKQERHKKVDEIFSAMEKKGELGNFFPGRMNPFYFNDTVAALIEDFSKEEVVKEGYLWREEEIKVDIPDRMEVVDVKELSKFETRKSNKTGEDERYIDPSILKKVIRDEEGNIYRVIKMEYDFLMKYGLPLPRKHWLARLKGHFKVR